jgi:hypothetical protein
MLEWLLRGRRTDLVPPSEVPPSSDPLLAAHDAARTIAYGAIAWYDRANRDKRNYAFLLRGAALALGTAAAATPVLLQVAEQRWPATGLSGLDLLPTVMLTLAGGFIAFDRFGDYSAGWVRYTNARTRLSSALNSFDLAWLHHRAAAPDPDDPGHRRAGFALTADLVSTVNAVIQAETDAWAAAFQAELKATQEDLERSAAAPGAVHVALSRPLTGVWFLTIDGVDRGERRGLTAAITGLTPGIHAIYVAGKDPDGRQVHAEGAVTVWSNSVARVTIELL